MTVRLTWSKAIVCVLSVLALSAHAAEVNGVLQVVKGDVQIKSGKTGALSKAKVGSKVFPKDSIITGKDSRAKIVMVDKNVLNVSPESNIEIQNYEYAPEQGKKDVLLNVIYGKVRSKVEQKYDGQSSKFQVKTATAVAGVRGTDFMASYQPSTSTSSVVTFEGTVAFGQIGEGGKMMNEVAVTPGKTTEVVGNSPPPEPRSVPSSELASMDSDSKADAKSDSGSDKREPAAKEDGGKDKDKAKGKDEGDKKDSQAPGDKKAGDDKKDQKSPDKAEGGDKPKAAEVEKGKGADSGDKGRGANADSGDKGKGASNDSGASRGGQGQSPGAGGSASTGAPGSSGSNGGGSMAGSPGTGSPGAGGGMMDRSPASPGMPPSPGGGGSMLLPTDMAGAPNAAIPPAMPAMPSVPQMPPAMPHCDFCDRTIENGTANININVTYPSNP